MKPDTQNTVGTDGETGLTQVAQVLAGPGGGGALKRVRHVKTGGEYEVLGEAEVQISTRCTCPDGPGNGVWPNSAIIRQARPGYYAGDLLVVYRDRVTNKLWCRLPDEFRDGRFETIAPAQPDDPASIAAHEAAADLERLSAAATQGEAEFEIVPYRIPECNDADLPGFLRIGNVQIAEVHEKYGPGVTPRYEADGAFIAALINAYRAGRLAAVLREPGFGEVRS